MAQDQFQLEESGGGCDSIQRGRICMYYVQCENVHMCVHAHAPVQASVRARVCAYLYANVCACVCAYVYAYVWVHMCVQVYVCMCMFACTWSLYTSVVLTVESGNSSPFSCIVNVIVGTSKPLPDGCCRWPVCLFLPFSFCDSKATEQVLPKKRHGAI